jgi:hypothetical protein
MWQLFIDAAWKVLVAGLVLGAGIPALFAAGVRLTAVGTPGADPSGTATAPRAVPLFLGSLCFLLAALAVALGITVVIAAGAGKMVSFDHVYPTIVDKA